MARRFIGLSIADRRRLPARCAGCAYWESARPLPRECGAACDAQLADEWTRRVADEWGECGRVAVEDGAFIGFVKYAPPVYVPQARHLPSGAPLPDAVLLTCLHIAPEARRHGVGGVLLRAALRDLASRGERTVQAYACTRGPYEDAPMVGVEFLLRHGFTVVRPHPEVPLLKLDLKSLASWTENLEAVLESLRIPRAMPAHAPATLAHGEGGR